MPKTFGVRVRVESPGDAVAFVRADWDRLVQVTTNLLSNAVKFTVPQTEVVVTIDHQDGGDLVRLSVRDHGSGIPADFRSAMLRGSRRPMQRMPGGRVARAWASAS